jgi:RNA polymerase sigma factor (TIGR02999 family)
MPEYVNLGTEQLTTLLDGWRAGNQECGQRLISALYPELRRLAAHYLRNERPGHTLQATALVHEVYIRLFSGAPIPWQNRAHFFAAAAQQLRRILVDHARTRKAQKRGGAAMKISLTHVNGVEGRQEQNVLDLHDALTRLHELDPRAARIVELRFFGGMKDSDIAEVLGISIPTVQRDWRLARAWLGSELTGADR